MMKKNIGKYIFLSCLVLTGLFTYLFRSTLQNNKIIAESAQHQKEIPAAGKEKPRQKTDDYLEKTDTQATQEEDSSHQQEPLEEAKEETKEAIKEETKEFKTVSEQYLDGALFIGDSRTSTLAVYGGWKTCHFWVQNGISIWEVMDAKIATAGEKENLTVRQGLTATQYSKIYIMLGINELGTGTPKSFYEQYEKVIQEMHKMQPKAKIFVQSILHVTDGKDQTGSYINNGEINKRNLLLSEIDQIEGVYYLDLNSTFDDPSTKKLNPNFSTDGVHLRATQIDKWKTFLLEHGIED